MQGELGRRLGSLVLCSRDGFWHEKMGLSSYVDSISSSRERLHNPARSLDGHFRW